jgi:hypothetical protein
MPSPTDGPLDPFPAGHDLLVTAHPLARAWLAPVRRQLAVMEETKGKPIGQFTMPEVIAWATVILYAVNTGMLAGMMAGNVLRVAVRGR